MPLFIRSFVLALLLAVVSLADASAQDLAPRFGFGFNGMLSTVDGLGIGFRGRVSAPLNTDLSIALDAGLTGFVLRGRDDASYVFDPQVSAIVTLPTATNRSPYIIGGLGAYVSFSSEPEEETTGGPTIHGGMGWVQRLNETTIFYELDPALLIGETSVDLVLPFRIGVIF